MSRVPAASQRCAPQARRRRDEMLGTAFPASRLLLVEEPFPWGPEGLRTSRFDRATALALEARGRAEGVRVQAIRRPGRSVRGVTRRWAAVDTRDASRTLRWGEFSEDAELLELALDGSTGTVDPRPLYLVCTHGRHDPCCARYGRSATVALLAASPDRVWQASHLGGCRFAPTVLALPLGLMYGRVPPAAVRDLVTATEAGAVHSPLLRGQIGVPPAAQAALGYVHTTLALPRRDEVRLVSTQPVDPGTVLVRIAVPDAEVEVTVRRRRVDASGLTCAAPGPSWFVAHDPVALSQVEIG